MPSPKGRKVSHSPSTPGGPSGQPNAPNNQAAFINKLYSMLEDQNVQNLIYWDPTGTYFIVNNITEFSKTVLPQYFKHNNFASFVRQLNMYGFHKINDMFHSNSSDVWEFKHPDFRRGEVELLQSIKRKATKQSQLQRSMADMSSDEKVTHLTHRVEELEQKLVKLHESYNLLWTETMSSRALQSKHHQIITSITQYLASNVDEEADKSAKRRKLDVDTLVGEVAKISNPNQHHINGGTRQDPHSMLPSPDSANSEYPPQGVWPASGPLPSRPETSEGMGMVMTGPPGQIYRGEEDYYSHRNDNGKRRAGIGAPVG